MQFENYIKKVPSKFRSRYACFVSSQLATRLSDHLHLRIDIIFIFSVKAWPRSEYSTKTHEYHEDFGEN